MNRTEVFAATCRCQKNLFSSGKYMHTTTKSPFKILFDKLSRSSSRYVLKGLNYFCCFSSHSPILKDLAVHINFNTYLHHIGYMVKNHIPVLSWSISTAFATALNLNFTLSSF